MFVKEHCSPRKDEIKDSCLKKKTLLSIAKILNKKNNTKIKLKKTSKKKLYSETSNPNHSKSRKSNQYSCTKIWLHKN